MTLTNAAPGLTPRDLSLQRDFRRHADGLAEQKTFGEHGLELAGRVFKAWRAYQHEHHDCPRLQAELQHRSLFTYLSELIAAHTRGDPFSALATCAPGTERVLLMSCVRAVRRAGSRPAHGLSERGFLQARHGSVDQR